MASGRMRWLGTTCTLAACLLAGCTADPGPGQGRSTSRTADPGSATAEPSPPASTRSGHAGLVSQEVSVATSGELERALAAAGPGTVITLAPGTYVRDGGDRWVATNDGTAREPIVVRGPRSAILASDGITGDYGLHVTGDHYVLQGFSVREATKGIVLDGSVGTVIDGVDVGEVGEEGVHFRSCSSDGILRNSTIHDTGRRKPQFGEGVYVGSANSNWDRYACRGGVDDTEGVLIEGNTFRDIAAEGADIKEGIDSGTIKANTFDNAGFGGENSADSAIDLKGNGWVVSGNTIRNPTGAAHEGIQIHSVAAGYGNRNVVEGNTVEGVWPGFGIGAYPLWDNVIRCTNVATQAALGLVGDHSEPASCT